MYVNARSILSLGSVGSPSPNGCADQSSLRDFIEIYAKLPGAISDDLFIYIGISNLCDGARARVYISKTCIEAVDLF